MINNLFLSHTDPILRFSNFISWEILTLRFHIVILLNAIYIPIYALGSADNIWKDQMSSFYFILFDLIKIFWFLGLLPCISICDFKTSVNLKTKRQVPVTQMVERLLLIAGFILSPFCLHVQVSLTKALTPQWLPVDTPATGKFFVC